MASLSVLHNSSIFPVGLWQDLFQRLRNSDGMRQVTIDYQSLNYALVGTDHKVKFVPRQGFLYQPRVFNYWIAECEEKGCIAVSESGSIVIFDKNVPRQLIPKVAFRYSILDPVAAPFSLDYLGYVSLCRYELESVLQESSSGCQLYRDWIVNSAKKGVSYPGELLSYIYPYSIELLEKDKRATRRIIEGLVEKLNDPPKHPLTFVPDSSSSLKF